MQTCFYCPHSLLIPEASFLAVTLPSHYQQAQEAGTESIYFTLTVATDLFHLLFLLPAFLPPLSSYCLSLKVLSFLSPYARCHEGKGCSVLELGICSSHTALQQGWTGQAHDGAALLFPQPQGWSRTAHVLSQSFCNSWKCFHRQKDHSGPHVSLSTLCQRRMPLLTCKSHVLGVCMHGISTDASVN